MVLTALALEYKAVRVHLTSIREEVHKGTVYERGIFETAQGSWQVGIVQIGAGNPGAAAETERAIAYFQPDIVLFVGVAGGLKDVQIGDVVVSTKVYGYEAGKVNEKSFLVRPEIGLPSHRLVQRAMAEARKEGWQQRVQQENLPGRSTSAQVYTGPIAAGEKVLASRWSETFLFLQKTFNDALAVEMEGLGFFQAVQRNETVQALIVRGISDLLDKKQSSDAGGSQMLAARHASAFAFEVLARLDAQTALRTPSAEVLTRFDVQTTTQTPSSVQAIRLIDFHLSEQEDALLLDITLYNGDTKPIFPSRAVIETLASGIFLGVNDNQGPVFRSYVPASQIYEMVLSGTKNVSSIKIAHMLQPGEADRFQLRVTQGTLRPGVAATWFQARVAIYYDVTNLCAQSEPFLFTLPALAENKRQSWQLDKFAENRDMLAHIADLPGMRSATLEAMLRQLPPATTSLG